MRRRAIAESRSATESRAIDGSHVQSPSPDRHGLVSHGRRGVTAGGVTPGTRRRVVAGSWRRVVRSCERPVEDLSPDFLSNRRGKLGIAFGVHLGNVGPRVSERDLGGLQPELLPNFRGVRVAKLVRMPAIGFAPFFDGDAL